MPSAAKETTSTTAAAQPNSHSGQRQVRALDEPVGVRGVGDEQRRRGGGGEDAAPPQRRMAKKTWMPLLQRKVIFEPVKSRQVKPRGFLRETR